MKQYFPGYRHILLFIFLLVPACTRARNTEQYNINSSSGLPSNHVYYSIEDRYGYLWMATDKGVVKYNGYNYKIFDLSTGLANDDVWKLFEDKDGKVWLMAIANEVGYIYKDKYRAASPGNSSFLYYPKEMINTPGGIAFVNLDKGLPVITMIIDDTVVVYDPRFRPGDKPLCFIDDNLITTITNNIMYTYQPAVGGFRKQVKRISFEDAAAEKNYNTYYTSYNDQIVSYGDHDIARIYAIDCQTGRKKEIILDSSDRESIYTPYVYKDKFYITTNKCVYLFNKKMALCKKIPVDSLLPGNNQSNYVISLLESKFWGNCIATGNQGIYIGRNREGVQPVNIDLQGYNYIGEAKGHKRFWWNKTTETLLYIDSNISANKVHTRFKNIRRVLPYDGKQSLLITPDGAYWLPGNTGNGILRKAIVTEKNVSSTLLTGILNGITASVVSPRGVIYYTSRGSGLCKMIKKGDTLEQRGISHERVLGVAYDHLHSCVWAFDQQRILIYNIQKDRLVKFDNTAVARLGIKKIEQIAVDNRYGNVFIKEHNHLFVYYPGNNTCKEILKTYNLKNAQISISGNQLVVAGTFGILFCKINGVLDFSRPCVHHNIKNTKYNEVRGLYSNNTSAYIVSDRGTWAVPLPGESESRRTGGDDLQYRFYISYNDSMYSVTGDDTINIDQKNHSVYLDVINPSGNGNIKYTYYIKAVDSTANELNAGELFLPDLPANRYYTMYVTAYDDVWRSIPHKVHLYVIPYWWQTDRGIRIIWISFIVAAVLLIYVIVYITKRMVSRKHIKKNLQLELKNLNLALELKSLYAQINPHFIFNTLSTGLYFIKKKRIEEAYAHIASFSDLLRAYIRSSRTKFITIAEEVNNLTNYISLQQARFENKFHYHIFIDNAINATTTRIPALLLQPLVENAINHGLLPVEGYTGILTIEFRKGAMPGEIVCIIEDNGIGRAQSKLYNEKSKVKKESYGTDLIHELIEVFNKYEQIHIDLSYTDKSEPLHGTIVTITIKQQKDDQ